MTLSAVRNQVLKAQTGSVQPFLSTWKEGDKQGELGGGLLSVCMCNPGAVFIYAESLKRWYKKYINMFLTTWNQLRVSLATNGKQLFPPLAVTHCQPLLPDLRPLVLTFRGNQNPGRVLWKGHGSQEWLHGALASPSRPGLVLHGACQLPHCSAQWPGLLYGKTLQRDDQVGALKAYFSFNCVACANSRLFPCCTLLWILAPVVVIFLKKSESWNDPYCNLKLHTRKS